MSLETTSSAAPSGAADTRSRGLARVVPILLMMLGLVGAGGLVAGGAAYADTSPYAKGPAPTASSIRATQGPFTTGSVKVPAGNGFGGGTIWFPSAAGTYGAVAVAPGYTETESAISWYGPRVASQGFVVFTISTNTTGDNPAQRADQMLAALDYLTTQSSVKEKVDSTRLAVMGHSMGGGGALRAARDNPGKLKAAISLSGWNPDSDYSEMKTPSLVISAQNDIIAPDAQHSRVFYDTMPADLDKAYLLLAGADHMRVTKPSDTIAAVVIPWLKRFLDDDSRFSQFLCPGPSSASDPAVAKYKATCPLGSDSPSTTPTPDPTPTPTPTPDPTPTNWWSWLFKWFDFGGFGTSIPMGSMG